MNSQNCTVKDMLNNGFSPEQMLNNLQREIAEAQAQIDAEKRAAEAATKTKSDAEEALIEARINVADALIDYVEALDVLPVEVIDEIETNDVVDLLIEVEDQIKAYAQIAGILGKLEASKPTRGKRAVVHHAVPPINIDDKIISDFLKSLD